MSNLWKPAALAAYCNQGRSGSSLVDSGPFGRTATLQKAGSWSQIAGHKDRWAIDLDGTQYATVPTTAGGLTHGASLTVTAWIAPASYGSSNFVICGNRGLLAGFMFLLNASNSLVANPWGGTQVAAVLPGSLVGGDWHHAAMRYRTTPEVGVDLFWDGVKILATDGPAMVPASGTGAQMGIWVAEQGNSTNVAFTAAPMGKGADLCFWDYLTDEEIAWLASPSNNVVSPGAGSEATPHLIAPSLSHGVIG